MALGLLFLSFRLIGALDKALERQQVSPVLPSVPTAQTEKPSVVPAKPPVVNQPLQPAATVSTAVLDEALVAFVKREEGFKATAYGDFKQYSIGYGTKANSPNEVIDVAEADRRLRVELAEAVSIVEKFIPNAPKGVKQAMADLTYNAGPVWERQGLGTLLAQGDYEGAKVHLSEYNHAGGKVNDDLTRRREKEIAMFNNPL